MSEIIKMIGATEENNLTGLLSLLNSVAISAGQTSYGYAFNVNLFGNAENLAAAGYSMNPGGAFTPSLYKKFPNAKPIFYNESFNAKAGAAQTE